MLPLPCVLFCLCLWHKVVLYINHAQVRPDAPITVWSRLNSCTNSLMGNLTGTFHHKSRTKEHRAWRNARYRCRTVTSADWSNYGGRGIRFCERWDDFRLFFADIGECPPNHTLERRNNDGHYEPANCYWASYTTQENNKRSNKFVTYKGQRQTVRQLSRLVGVPSPTLWRRLH